MLPTMTAPSDVPRLGQFPCCKQLFRLYPMFQVTANVAEHIEHIAAVVDTRTKVHSSTLDLCLHQGKTALSVAAYSGNCKDFACWLLNCCLDTRTFGGGAARTSFSAFRCNTGGIPAHDFELPHPCVVVVVVAAVESATAGH